MTEPTEPTIEVVSGSPTDEELAAVLIVLSAAKRRKAAALAATVRTDLPTSGGWKSYWRTIRREHRPGPGAWHHAVRRG